MSIATRPSSPPADYHSSLTPHPDDDFERRWTAWKSRGLAHERAVRQRLIMVAIVAGTIALAAASAYGLLAS